VTRLARSPQRASIADMTSNCFTCDNNARIGSLPLREEIALLGAWRVAHAFGSALPGWLVVVPDRHVAALHEMPRSDAAQLGEILRTLSAAHAAVLGSEKSYVVFFAEADGFAHLHVHVVPRMPWFSHDESGPRVFSLLGVPPEEEVPESERDALALRLRAAIEDQGQA
jgi:diadenosine tetraphosphate (Ap4A) HIT family hydrolase